MATTKEKLEKIPVELRALVNSSDIDNILEEIADEFDIPETWRGEFIRPVIAVLVGELTPKDFVPTLSDNLVMTTDEALMLARKVNEKIFSVVKPFLAELYAIEDKKIARKLKIPRKPKIVMVQDTRKIDEVPLVSPEATPIPGIDTAPVEVIPPSVQPTFAPTEPQAAYGSVPSPLTMHFASRPDERPVPLGTPVLPHTQPESVDVASLQTSSDSPAPLQKPAEMPSSLSQKLGGMRSSDKYRELPD